MKRHKYLEDIGVPLSHTPYGGKDRKKFKKQRKKYGFDSRECYDLDETFYYWLYERLKMYLKDTDNYVDLVYHKFIYNDKEYCQLDLINMMLERLEFSFSDRYNNLYSYDFNYVHEIEKIWAVVLPAMWW